jgi:hypothetical protein
VDNETSAIKNRDVSVIWPESRPTRTSAQFDPGWSTKKIRQLDKPPLISAYTKWEFAALLRIVEHPLIAG